jgi:hypothetical protein
MKLKLDIGDRVKIIDKSHPYYNEIGYISGFGRTANPTTKGKPIVQLAEIGGHEVFVTKDGGVKKV